MITEDYVSFEVAKLLKEKGFYGECFSMYVTPKPHCGMGDPNEPKIAPHGRDSHYYEGYLYQCEAPTLQMAMKWLEIKKHIAIIPVLSSILDNEKFLWDVKIVIAETGEKYSQGWVYENREQVCEAAIKYTLENLI